MRLQAGQRAQCLVFMAVPRRFRAVLSGDTELLSLHRGTSEVTVCFINNSQSASSFLSAKDVKSCCACSLDCVSALRSQRS